MKFLFDLGGVFFDWDPNHFFKDIILDTKEREYFLSNICNDEWNTKQDSGRAIIEAENELIHIYPQYINEIRMYYKNHRKMIKGIFNISIDLLRDLKSKEFECYVLSNWSAETFEGMIEDYPFLKNFDGILISGACNLIKPDKKIYELAIKKFNLRPNQTVFIDDKLENIKAAKDLGFKTIHLLNPKKIKDAVGIYLN